MGLRAGHPYDYRHLPEPHRWPRRWEREYDHGRHYREVGYFGAVRHPLVAFLFVGLLLAFYEIAVSQAVDGEPARAGVEQWLRHWLAQSGPWPTFVIPAALLTLVLLWSLIRWNDRPGGWLLPLLGTAAESALFAVGLWFVAVNAPAVMEANNITINAAILGLKPEVATFVGVGIYEEAIFRMIGFALLARILRLGFMPGIAAIPIALIVSSAGFAMAHHFVTTDPFVPVVFLTRCVIGLYLGILFWARGMGVAVGAHIGYDLMVGLPQG